MRPSTPPSARGADGSPSAPRRAIDPKRSEVTLLLAAWQKGDRDAFDRLVPLVYDELRRLARSQLRRDAGQWTLQATALVHETYLRLAGADVTWEGRDHFFSIAARVMRQVLVDEARRRQADKRGGGIRPLELEAGFHASDPRCGSHGDGAEAELLALDQALTELATLDPRRARVVELRYFAGMTIEETARVLALSHATIERDLKLARAWLLHQLRTEI